MYFQTLSSPKLSVVLILKIYCVIQGQALYQARGHGRGHPLDPLTPQEIRTSSQIIHQQFPVSLAFPSISLKEPPKSELLHYYLDNIEPPHDAFPRKAFAVAIDEQSETALEIVVNLQSNLIESVVKVPRGLQPILNDLDNLVTPIVLSDEDVLKRLQVIGIVNTTGIVVDFWDFGYSGDRPEYNGRRIVQCFLYVKAFEGDNYFVHPLSFVPIVDVLKKVVLDIEELPIHQGFELHKDGEFVPHLLHNYDPTLLKREFFRADMSTINQVQPKGPSYQIHGNRVHWQNFNFRLGFNDREGLILHHIMYEDSGRMRPLIYRASISELFVPYADPRPPLHRRMAFDAGQYGLGNGAHSLRAPSDCKGSVHFLNVVTNTRAGLPIVTENAICVFEEDAGIITKKYDSTTGRSFVVRSQRLVVTFTATLSNYDYQFKWMFYQDASIKFEVEMHGINYPTFIASNSGTEYQKYGIITAPNILNSYHQHLFMARIDAEIDGNYNTVAMIDVVPKGNTGSSTNPYGNAFTTKESILRNPAVARTNANIATARTWNIYGESHNLHPVTNTKMGYSLHAENPAHLYINPDSPLYPKCGFLENDVWVTKFHEDQLYAGDRYLNNSGLPEWVRRNPSENLVNEDIVLWHSFGFTHITRAEDFPVMPVQRVGFSLMPRNFFRENPAINVPSFLHIPRKT